MYTREMRQPTRVTGSLRSKLVNVIALELVYSAARGIGAIGQL